MSQYQGYTEQQPKGKPSTNQRSQSRGPLPSTNQSNLRIENFQNQVISSTVLQWSSIGDGQGDIIIHGQSDYTTLKNLRNILLALQTEFSQGGSKVIFTGDKKDDFNKRLILLENQIDGLLKRKINYTVRDQLGGTRVMDYTVLLNQKQVQIIELQKKINNLQQRLRRSSQRQIQLENHITKLYSDLKRKQDLIISKNQIILSEVTITNMITKIKKNIDNNRNKIGADLEKLIFDGINFSEIGSLDIKPDNLTRDGASSRSRGYQNQPQTQKYKTQLIQLFRQFQRLNNKDTITDNDIQKIMESFLIGFNGTKIKQSVQTSITRRKTQQNYYRLSQQFGVAVGIFKDFIDKLKVQNPQLRLQIDPKIFDILKQHKIQIYKTSNNVVHLERFCQKTVEVPVQDSRTKHLIHLLAVQMKKFCNQYPKLKDEMDKRLVQFFQQELIDIIEVDQIERVVEIVKYVPQVVKVQNVYAYSSQKSRKIQFHLRVLVKALLEQLQKIKKKTNVVLEIDEGIIGLINQQIMGIVDVDDILKVFRVVPKIVQVQKIVQKIVDRIVEVPQVVSVEKIVQKIVEVEKIKQIQKIVNVPLEIPTIVQNIVEKIVPIEKTIQKVVQVPQIVQKIVQVVKQVPKIQIVQRIQQKPVEVEKIVEVQRVVNHFETKYEPVQLIVEKIVPTQKITQIIRQVPIVVQKIVQKKIQIPKIIEIQKIVEKIVPQIEVVTAQQIDNHIQVRYQIVDRIVQKPIIIYQTVERIVQVPQVIEKIVTVQKVVQQIKEVERIQEKIVVQQKIIQIIKQVQIPIEVIREVPKEIQKIIQIPVIHQKLITVQEFIEKPVIQKIQSTIVKEVYLRDPIIIRQPKTIQVEKIINHYIDVPKPIKYIEEKLVQVVKHVDRIKQIKVPVQKVIQKMVEVPKVVEIERVVEKVVVVPRVVQKVVEVPQIIEKVVPKIIVQQKIVQIQRNIQVPIIQQKIIQVEVPKNVYIEVQKIVQKIVEKLVQVPQYSEKIINNDVIIEKVIQIIKQVPKNMEIQKIVHLTMEKVQVVQLQRQIIVPIQIPVPTQKIIQRIVPVTEIIEKPIQIPQVIEKVVTIQKEVVEVQQVERFEQKIVTNVEIQQVIKQVPYITERLVEVEKLIQKIVPVQKIVQQIVTAQQIIQKIAEKTNTITRVQQVEKKIQKLVQLPKIIQVQKMIPQIINVNRYIQNIVQKIVEVPIIVEQIKQVVRENQKIVEVKSQYETVKEVQSIIQKSVFVEKFKQAVRNINHIEKVLEIVDRYEQNPVQVIIQQQKLVEVPYILQKIVEKIVVMPQIVQVLKYVHQVTQNNELGVAVGQQITTHEQKLKSLTKDIKTNFDVLLSQLRKLKQSNPNLKAQIEIIQKFLGQLEQFILYPKIFQVPTQKIVEKVVQKDKIVTIPTQDQRSIKMELSLSLLVEKLIIELKRLKRDYSNINIQLEDDVKLIFFTQLNQNTNVVSSDFNAKLKSFSDSVYRKFESLGNWTHDHRLMLNSFLQQRFLMANLVKNANLQIEKIKNISGKRDEAMKKLQTEIGVLEAYIEKIRAALISCGLTVQQQSALNNIFRDYDAFAETRVVHGQPTRMLGQLNINDARIQSLIREKDTQILKLRDKIFSIEKGTISTTSNQQYIRFIDNLKEENAKLKRNMSDIEKKQPSPRLMQSLTDQNETLKKKNLSLEQENSNLKNQINNMKRQYEVKLQASENAKVSHITDIESTLRSPNIRSPLQRHPIQSPDFTSTTLVDSQIRTATDPNQHLSRLGGTTTVSRLQDSGYSGTGGANRQTATYEQQQQQQPQQQQSRTGPTATSGIYQSGGSSTSGYGGLIGSGTQHGSSTGGGNLYQTGTGSRGVTGASPSYPQGQYYQTGPSSGLGGNYLPTSYSSQQGTGSSYTPYQRGTGNTYGRTQQTGQSTGTTPGSGTTPGGTNTQSGSTNQGTSGTTRYGGNYTNFSSSRGTGGNN